MVLFRVVILEWVSFSASFFFVFEIGHLLVFKSDFIFVVRFQIGEGIQDPTPEIRVPDAPEVRETKSDLKKRWKNNGKKECDWRWQKKSKKQDVRSQASSCPGICCSTLCFYYVASFTEGMVANQDCTIFWYNKSMLGFEITKFSSNCTQTQIVGLSWGYSQISEEEAKFSRQCHAGKNCNYC